MTDTRTQYVALIAGVDEHGTPWDTEHEVRATSIVTAAALAQLHAETEHVGARVVSVEEVV